MNKTTFETDKYYNLASEVKISVISRQRVPTGTSPYLTVYGCPQTDNKNINFGDMMVNDKMQ